MKGLINWNLEVKPLTFFLVFSENYFYPILVMKNIAFESLGSHFSLFVRASCDQKCELKFPRATNSFALPPGF